ncbi:MAG: hypothetical protein KF915_22080 [Polyangiaceae bacterium]|nr:hypothetical protein [Polyangiaceae bacterium]
MKARRVEREGLGVCGARGACQRGARAIEANDNSHKELTGDLRDTVGCACLPFDGSEHVVARGFGGWTAPHRMVLRVVPDLSVRKQMSPGAVALHVAGRIA